MLRGGVRLNRIPIVGVMGSGVEPQPELAHPLGEWLARRGVHLLTGGGGGVMAAVSEAFHGVRAREGSVLAVLPWDEGRETPVDGYPNRWVEIPIQTHLGKRGEEGGARLSRNHINVLTSDVVVVLPGRAGTASEVRLALRYGRPIVAFAHFREQVAVMGGKIPVHRDLSEVASFVNESLSRFG